MWLWLRASVHDLGTLNMMKLLQLPTYLLLYPDRRGLVTSRSSRSGSATSRKKK